MIKQKKTISLLLVGFTSFHLFAQNDSYFISGRVIDAGSKEPLQSASVFAQNTTRGTNTDSAGNFKLALPAGGYDLVITFIGYQTEIRKITAANVGNEIVVELKQRENALADVSITSGNEVKDGWEKYGAFFLKNFIGETENSKNCIIKNKEIIKFYFSKRKNRLKILADGPLEISNAALGYNIKYALDSFVYDYNAQITFYRGYPLFEEMRPRSLVEGSKWRINRLQTYKGSMLHFMRCVYTKRLKEEGFEILFLTKTNDEPNASLILNYYADMNYSKNDSTQRVEISPKQNNVAVIYNWGRPEKMYIDANPDAPQNIQLSVLSFTPNNSIIIEVNGYYSEQIAITKSEYLSWKRVADMLPYDFKSK